MAQDVEAKLVEHIEKTGRQLECGIREHQAD